MAGFKFFKAVNPINYVWRFDNAFESFSKNYNKAYLDGQRVEHQVYTQTNKKGEATMSGHQQSYEYHLQLLENLNRSLEQLQLYMESIEGKYLQQINAMESAGFFDVYINSLQQRYSVFQQKMQNLQDMIDRHKVTIKTHEDAIQYLIQQARG